MLIPAFRLRGNLANSPAGCGIGLSALTRKRKASRRRSGQNANVHQEFNVRSLEIAETNAGQRRFKTSGRE
jgi:hypothetical protein